MTKLRLVVGSMAGRTCRSSSSNAQRDAEKCDTRPAALDATWLTHVTVSNHHHYAVGETPVGVRSGTISACIPVEPPCNILGHFDCALPGLSERAATGPIVPDGVGPIVPGAMGRGRLVSAAVGSALVVCAVATCLASDVGGTATDSALCVEVMALSVGGGPAEVGTRAAVLPAEVGCAVAAATVFGGA